jgi:hypothetical protein
MCGKSEKENQGKELFYSVLVTLYLRTCGNYLNQYHVDFYLGGKGRRISLRNTGRLIFYFILLWFFCFVLFFVFLFFCFWHWGLNLGPLNC